MQNSPGGNGVRKLGWLASAVAAALLGAGGEAEAGGYVDGAIDETLTNCSTGDFAMGIGGRTGYYVDPVLQTPKLGQVVYIHAAATNLNPCDVAGTTIGFDFFLPPGAVTAVSAGTPVKCYIGNGTTGAEVTEHCLQTPEVGVYGGLFFGYESKIARGWSFEIQVPVIFNQSLAGQTIDVYASSSFGTAVSSVAVTVPYAAAAPPPPPQPTPSPFAIGNDIALLGSAATGSTLPVAFSNDDGSFTVTSRDVGDFAVWARTPNVQRLSGDFNGDGLTDFALVGGAGVEHDPGRAVAR